MSKKRIKKFVSRIIRNITPYDKFGILKKLIEKRNNSIKLEENQLLESAPPLYMDWPKGIKKPFVGLVKSENGPFAYWPKFERFLKNNNIEYDFLDIKSSNFISEVCKFDIIVWRTPSNYSEQWEGKDKIEFIQNFLGKMTLPNKDSLWFYEDKIRQQWLFEINKLPAIKTFISYSFKEIEKYINENQFPIILKDKTSSSSSGVRLIKSRKKARKIVRKIFGNGYKLYENYIRQKNYVIFQEAVPNYGFDLRVIIIGDSYFGYYRYPKEGDFKASGSGIVEKKDIPLDVLMLAKKVKEVLPKSYMLAVDFLQDRRDDKYYIIEASIFIAIESSEQLMVNGVPGRYIEKNGKFIFKEGRFWLQELMMKELMNDWIQQQKLGGK